MPNRKNYRDYWLKQRHSFTFRYDPVPHTGAWSWRGRCRHVKTTQEIRENEFLNHYDEDARFYGIKTRRNRSNIPNLYEDPAYTRKGNGWKNFRKTRWKDK